MNDAKLAGAVVGIDGSPASIAALQWAAQRVDRFGPVRPVYVWDFPIAVWAPTPFSPGAVPPVEEMQKAATEAAATCVEDLESIPHAEPLVRRGDAGDVLVTEARDAAVLVIGTRGRGPVRANLLGSVGRHCADRTPVPLIIIPHTEPEAIGPDHDRIVVGVDGSEHSADALRWAIGNAGPEDEITAITTWQTPIDGPLVFGSARFDVRMLKAAARDTVNDACDKACAELWVDPDRVHREITEGDPRWVLMSREEVADLLVLGQRGRSGLPHFFLGSTTTALIHRPRCPIAVIPA
jgi:nucleotide-binding universal stress UspA family protein